MEPAITAPVCSLERCQHECRTAFATLVFACRQERDLMQVVASAADETKGKPPTADPDAVNRILELRDYAVARVQEWVPQR